jgi:hypothetical protein
MDFEVADGWGLITILKKNFMLRVQNVKLGTLGRVI